MTLTSTRMGGLDAAWLIAIALSIALAPLALAWCVGEGVRRMIRIFRRVGP